MHRCVAQTIDNYRQRLQVTSLASGRTKLAEGISSVGGDQGFEQAFSNLAHAFVREKSPSLLDHEIGFQLLDQNEENTKAVGVIGFKLGSQLLFAPVFFLQGDLKGHELLYIKNQDMFVPMSEKWLNYLMQRKPNILGSPVGRNVEQLGVQQPDLNRLSRSPGKYAAWVQECLPKFAAITFMDVGAELAAHRQELNLPMFCKESASLDQLQWLVGALQCFPKIAQAVIAHHGSTDFLTEAVRAASAREKSAGSVLDPSRPQRRAVGPRSGGSVLDVPPPEHPVKTGALRVVTYEATQQTGLPEGLDEADADKLVRDGVLIQDSREGDEVSVPYNVQVEQKLFNPMETGIYMILTKPGQFEKCFVAHQPVGPNGRVRFATVVRLDEGERNWLNAHPSHLWACSRIEGEEYDKWYDGLSDPSSLPDDNKRHMLIGPRANATLPFQVENTLGNARGETSYEVDFSDRATHHYSESLLAPSHRGKGDCRDWSDSGGYDKREDGQRIHLDAKEGTQLRSSRGDVWIPKDYKILNLQPSERDKAESKAKSESNGNPCCVIDGPNDEGQSDPPPIRPGNILDAELGIMSKFAVEVDGSRSTTELLIDLVCKHGLQEGPARVVIKQAQALRKPHMVYIHHAPAFEKQAITPSGDPYLTHGGPTAPGFPEPSQGGDNVMGYPGRTITHTEHELPIPGMNPNDNRAAYDIRPGAVGEPMDFDHIQRAISSGQEEVFDVSMIGSMLKSVRDDTMVDKYIPDLMKALDRLGRILFMFYWHGDKFADRFGQQDMPELEDALRNSFEDLGDLIIFLKQKTIEPYPEEDAADLGVGEGAAAG